ncbi:MAG: ATP-binding protein [Candidatus Binataceae bacterium]|jgi:signal transduction histidine kinase
MRAKGKAIKSMRVQVTRGDRSRPEHEVFEALVYQLSAAMARASATEIDQEIEHWLGESVHALDVDRGAVWEREASDGGFVGTHWWDRPGIPRLPSRMRAIEISPWATARVLAGESIVYSSPEELPKEAVKLSSFLRSHGPKAGVVLPLQISGLVLGALAFGKFRAPRDWRPNELQRLRIVGQIIAGALDRKRAVLQSRKLREEIEVASRRSTLGELTGSIAHELNQPLGAILSNLGGLARLASQGNPDPAMALTAVLNAIEDTKRASEIVRRLRAMFKGHKIRKMAIDVGALVKEVVNLVSSEAVFREVTVRIEISPSLPQAMGDRVLIQQCVLNLLMNALDATAQTKSGPREVTIRVAPEKTGWIGVSMRDSGGGVAPSVANRMFEPFVTTKTKGMGLGLLVTRSIVEDHGGRIWYTPNPNGGSTFTFTLPVAQRQRARASRAAQ